jgi:hypothetical protein
MMNVATRAEATILKFRPLPNAAGTMLAILNVQLPSGSMLNDCKLMRGPQGVLWINAPDKPRICDNAVVLDPHGKPIWDRVVDFASPEDRKRFGALVLSALRRAHPELWEEQS